MDVQENNIKPIDSGILEELTGRELNDRIVSSAGFKCKQCWDILRPPITLVKYLGNICGMCKGDFDDNLGIHNEMLEVVLQNLILPCKYNKNGCNKRLNYYEINNHNLICNYRNFICPLKVLTNCDWTQSLALVKHHFKENHKNALLNETDSCFELEIDISKNFELIRILDNYTHLFVCHLCYNTDDLKLQCIVRWIENEKEFPKLHYKVRPESISHGTNMRPIIKNKNFNSHFNIDEALHIDLSQDYYESKLIMNIYIEIINTVTIAHKVDEEILKNFECPGCNNYMKYPIYQCKNGHSTCNICKFKLQFCPLCQACLTITRNYSFEKISNNFFFPCMYLAQGCSVIETGLKIVEHENRCPLLPYKCPNKCGWIGVYDELLQHIKIHYPNITEDAAYFNKSVIDAGQEYHYLIACNRLFGALVCLRSLNDFSVFIYLIGPKDESKMFKYEFGLINGKCVDTKTVFTDICKEPEDAGYIYFPPRIISEYANNSQLTFYWKIIKVVDTDHKKKLRELLSKDTS